MNFDILINAAKNKGLKYDTWSAKFDRWGELVEITYVQINTQKHVWCTWAIYKNENFAFFEGRYNQVNGALQKTYKKEINAYKILGIY